MNLSIRLALVAFVSATLSSLTSAASINPVSGLKDLYENAAADASSIESVQGQQDSSPFDYSQLDVQSMRGKSGKGSGRNRCFGIVEHRRRAQELETTGKKRECHTDVWDLVDWFTSNEDNGSSFYQPFTDVIAWIDGDIEDATTFALVDYYGIWNRDAQDTETCPQGKEFGTKVEATVTVCDDTEVTIEALATEAIGFAQCLGQCLENLTTNNGVIFGATPDQICNEGAEPSLGTVDFYYQFTKRPEEKLSDLQLFAVNENPDYFPQVLFLDYMGSKDGNGNELDILQCATAEEGDEGVDFQAFVVAVEGVTCPDPGFPENC